MSKITTTLEINKLLEKIHRGEAIKRSEQIFFRNCENTLDANVTVLLTKEEQIEWSKCEHDIEYFIEKYCNIYNNSICLRSFQKEWIKHYIDNRYSIFMTSRQSGYSIIIACIHLHSLIFNKYSKILLLANKSDTSSELLDKVYKLYLRIPYFLKPGLIYKNSKSIKFSDGNTIKAFSSSFLRNLPNIEYTPNIISFLDYSKWPTESISNGLRTLIPMVAAFKNSKIIINSKPSGLNHFYDLVNNSERKDGDPLKNNYKTIKTYWWEVDGRGQAWKDEQIKMLGSTEEFNQEYDLQFVTKNNGVI